MSDTHRGPEVETGPDLVPIASITDPALVPQVHALLDEAGIGYMMQNEGVQNLVGLGSAIFGYNPATGAPVLCVDPARADEARALIAPLFEPVPTPVVVVTPRECPTCGRRLESEPGDPPLALCYHCGAALVGDEGPNAPTVLMEPAAGTECARIADQLRRSLRGGAWSGPAMLELLDGVTEEDAMARPVPGAHSIAEIVLHVTAWQDAARHRLAGEPARLQGEEDWPRPEAGEEAWARAVTVLDHSMALLVDALSRLEDASLDEPVLAGFSSRYVLLHGVVQHNLYHAGQVALLKRALAPAGEKGA